MTIAPPEEILDQSTKIARRRALPTWVVAFGPGLLVMLADTDAGNIITAADAGTRWGYRLLPLPLLLIPVLAAVQELAVRIGIYTGGGFGDLIRQTFGPVARSVAAVALISATIGSVMTEFTGIAGVGELFGISRNIILAVSVIALSATLVSGKYRTIERIAIVVGLFELNFLFIAFALHPSLTSMATEIADQKLSNPGYLFLMAALIGTTFNPWMIFYQASALSERKSTLADLKIARWDTWIGAVLTQAVTAAVLIGGAAAVRQGHTAAPLETVGQISQILQPALGMTLGRLVFGLGVVGASMAAAIVCSLACIWGLGELFGNTRERERGKQIWFAPAIVLFVSVSALVVVFIPDLVSLTIVLQVVNALFLPLIASMLLIVSVKALPMEATPKGLYLWMVTGGVVVVSITGLIGAVAGFM